MHTHRYAAQRNNQPLPFFHSQKNQTNHCQNHQILIQSPKIIDSDKLRKQEHGQKQYADLDLWHQLPVTF